MLLIDQGVDIEIPFDRFLKAVDTDKYTNSDAHYQSYKERFQQPAELALEAELPEVFTKLLEKGVNPSSYTAGSGSPEGDAERNQFASFNNANL